MKKKFAEAEREQKTREQQGSPQAQPANPGTPSQPGAPGQQPQRPNAAPVEKYRKVIETGSKLLEYYPKSRWVDDALFLMGISYYRLDDLGRAERKFTELITLFPKSKHVPEALIWKARALAGQNKADDASALLKENQGRMRPGPRLAELLFLLGKLAYDAKNFAESADYFDQASQQKQDRASHLTAHFYYGLSRLAQEQHEAARDAFQEVARSSSDVKQAYEAAVYWSRTELALKNYPQAESILRRLQTSERFAAFSEDVTLELGRLAVESGRIDDGIRLYQEYLDTHPTGERRGLAFYRLALIHRDHRVDLPTAKALLDSVPSSGASREVADSAAAAIQQISKGLLALERIESLQQNIAALEATTAADSNLISERTFSQTIIDTIAGAPLDSLMNPAGADSVSRTSQQSDSARNPAAVAQDSAMADMPPDTSVILMTPAELAADSLARVLAARDTFRHEVVTTGEVPVPAAPQPAAEMMPVDTALTAAQSRQTQLWKLRRDLQTAYLHVAEFYEYSLADDDSAHHYYRLAAASRVHPDTYWRANLYLARALEDSLGQPSAEALRHYQAIIEADSVPLPVQNAARETLKLPLIEIPDPPQVAKLHEAERALLDGITPADSVLRLYSEVIAYDSTTAEARMALYAKAILFEDSLRKSDSARVIYEDLLDLQPDSAQVIWLRAKLAPPDSASVFYLSDAQLFGIRPPVEAILEEKQDESGWPPPEESLRGRRFR